MEKRATDIIEEIKNVDNNVSQIVVPILKDTVKDYEKVINRQTFIIVLLIIVVAGMHVYSTKKYTDFISQFEIVGGEYTQDTGDSSNINDGIHVENYGK